MLALGLALAIQAWIVKPYQIPSGSMEPTLDIGQRVLVNRFLYHFKDPKIGDIVVFHPPEGAEGGRANSAACNRGQDEPCPSRPTRRSSDNFIKRIVAGPGDTLAVKEGHPVVNGKVDSRRALHQSLRSSDLQFAETDHDPTRPLLHDGRQSWGKR